MIKKDTQFVPPSDVTGIILIMGGPIDGFEYFGPFSNMQEAIKWMQKMSKEGHVNTKNVWFAEMTMPDV